MDTAGRRRLVAALAAVAAVVAGGAACGDTSATDGDPAGPPRIMLNEAQHAGGATVDVVGLPAADLAAVRSAPWAAEEWEALLRVTVAGGSTAATDRPAVLGDYQVAGSALRFTPRYPFDPGRQYLVVFTPGRLPASGAAARELWRLGPLTATVGSPAVERAPATRVARVYPTGAELPENQLRFYVHFSAPMGLAGGADYVRLLDEAGQVVDDAFLPLDLAMWNADRTRYTLLFDPGRVKRGIRPNEQHGRPLAAGRRFTLAVDDAWPDAHGLPLVEPYSRSFAVGPPEERAIDPAAWRIGAPAAGTRDPLAVDFDRALDHALLLRALLVLTPDGARVTGRADVRASETRWVFTPRESWEDREYRLTVLAALEDTAGNRVGRPFEVGTSAAPAGGGAAAPTQLSFRPTGTARVPSAARATR